MNKKGIGTAGVILLGILAVVIIGVLWVVGSYNGLVKSDVNVENQWANVQTAYQRRADLIPNLVDTVKGYRDYEESVLTKIVELRSQAGQAQKDVKSAKTPGELESAEGDMSSVLSRLMVIVEAYPDLKASENFLSLQDELAGTENRIKYDRDEFNKAVNIYKVKTRTFPSNIIAGMFGFESEKHKMFEAKAGTENAPNVDFE